MRWLLTSNASAPLCIKSAGDSKSCDMNTQSFCYWLDEMSVCSVCCLIVMIVFVSPPKANTKNLPRMIVWKSHQWREICPPHPPECIVLPGVIHGAFNDLWTVLLSLMDCQYKNSFQEVWTCVSFLCTKSRNYSVRHRWYKFSSIPQHTEQQCRSEIWGVLGVIQQQSYWAEGGARVNYSITDWLS